MSLTKSYPLNNRYKNLGTNLKYYKDDIESYQDICDEESAAIEKFLNRYDPIDYQPFFRFLLIFLISALHVLLI